MLGELQTTTYLCFRASLRKNTATITNAMIAKAVAI
jgi:hypothetical protein